MEVLIRATEQVEPKVFGSLAAIEEELREVEPHLIVVHEENDRSQWRVAGEVVATVRIDVSETVTLIENHEHTDVDCILSVDDQRKFAGSIEGLYTELVRALQEAVEHGGTIA